MAINIAIIVVLLACAAYCDHRWRHRPTYIHGWWHHIVPSGGRQRWNPAAWLDACQQSNAKSLARRNRLG